MKVFYVGNNKCLKIIVFLPLLKASFGSIVLKINKKHIFFAYINLRIFFN